MLSIACCFLCFLMALSHALRILVVAGPAHLQAEKFNLTLFHSLVLTVSCVQGVLRLRLHNKTSLRWEIAPRRGKQRSDLRKEAIVF